MHTTPGVLTALGTAVLCVVAACAQPTAADCDRACLRDLASDYLSALATNDPNTVPLADSPNFVENLVRLAPGEGLWRDATGPGSYRIIVADPVAGSVGGIAVVERRSSAGVEPALLAFRLQLSDGKIVEAEHLVSAVPDDADPENLAAPRPAMSTTVAVDLRQARAELVAIAESYYEALDRSDGTLAPFADDCERLENGMITAAYYLPPASFESVDVNGNSPPPVARDCIGQMSSRRFAYIDSIDHRRIAAVDPELGLAMGFSHFRQSMANGPHRMVAADGAELMWDELREPYDLPAAHIFRIADGKIHEVEAIGIFVDFDSPTGWE